MNNRQWKTLRDLKKNQKMIVTSQRIDLCIIKRKVIFLSNLNKTGQFFENCFMLGNII
jgi:hypothetical protein